MYLRNSFGSFKGISLLGAMISVWIATSFGRLHYIPAFYLGGEAPNVSDVSGLLFLNVLSYYSMSLISLSMIISLFFCTSPTAILISS
jgi:hypothetical protein